MTTVFNPQTQTVTITRRPLNETITVPFKDHYARWFVIEHLHSDGYYKSVLHLTELVEAWLMCDGFDESVPDGYKLGDWSHVRDSSYESLVGVAQWIATKRWDRTLDQIISDMLYNAAAVSCNPLDFLY